MSVYEAIETAMHGKDPDKYIGLLHDDFQFVRHQSGTTMDKAAMADMIRRMVASGGFSSASPGGAYSAQASRDGRS